MTDTTLRNGVTAMISSTKPAYAYGSPVAMLLKGTTAYDFYQFGLPADLHRGAIVQSVQVSIPQYGGPWAGTRTLSIRRVTSKWQASKVTWNNQPTVGTSTSLAKTDTAFGFVWIWGSATAIADVQAWVDGAAPNYGWRLSSTDSTGRYVNGFAHPTLKPTLEITYTYPAAQPTTLNPSAGAISVSDPVLTWDSDTPISVHVQVDPAANGVTPAFDSGVVSSTVEQLDLSLGAYAGLSAGSSTQWRVQVTSAAGVSPWSEWATFSRVAKPGLTITSPTTAVADSSPTISWTFAGQTKYQVIAAENATPAVHIYDSGVISSTATSHTISTTQSADGTVRNTEPITKVGTVYKFTVRAWDAVVRDGTPGDALYQEASVTPTLSYDAAVTAVTATAAVQASPSPWVDLTWTRTAAPDGWVIFRNGLPVFRAEAAADLLVSGTNYAWRDYTAAPNRAQAYRVAAVVGASTASTGSTVTITPRGQGIWIADVVNKLDVMLFGSDEVDATYEEDADVYHPIGGAVGISVVNSMRGLTGTFSGQIHTAMNRVAITDIDTLHRFKERPGDKFRLVWGDMNIPVVLRELNVTPRRQGTSPTGIIRNVTGAFIQTGELPFSVSL